MRKLNGGKFMRYKILEWNINQASNRDRKNRLPEILIKELKLQNPDIIVLTEFCFCDNATEFLEKTFSQRGYEFYPTEATQSTKNGQNEVLIAWRSEHFKYNTENSQSEIVTWSNNKPNYARVLLTDKTSNKNIIVAGVRITTAKNIPKGLDKETESKEYQKQATLRKQQMEYVYSTLDNYPIVIIAGDFNNYRRGTNLKNWNINEITCSRKEYKRYTPIGQSIYECEKNNTDFEFAEDHFVAKGCAIKDFVYDRTFIYWEKQVYRDNMDFTDWEKLIGFPDHAIIYGDIYFDID